MRRIRHRLLRVRLTWARAVGRVPRPYRRAMRNVLILWLIVAAAGMAVAVRPVAGDRAGRLAIASWSDVRRAAMSLPVVDELLAEQEELAGAVLKMALPIVWTHHRPQTEERPAWASYVRRVVQAATGVDIGDPVTLLSGALPGFADYVEHSAAALPASARTMAPIEPPRPLAPAIPESPAPVASAPVPSPAAPDPLPPSSTPPGPPELPAAPAVPGTPAPAQPPEHPVEPPVPPAASAVDRLRTADWGERCLVLIYHTHTSEMYRTDTFAPASADMYHRFNTTDTGIVHVGRVLAARLSELGVPACHVTAVHDWPSHPRAYIESRSTVRQFLAANPQVDIVLDVHRDAPAGLVATVGGRRAAQIAFVLGTHPDMQPNWRENAAFARALADMINARYPGLFRRIIERPDARLNQDLHPRAILVEIGSYDTHVNEAVASAEILAEVLADMLHVIRFGRSVFE